MNIADINKDLQNKEKVAIVCVGYNRIKSMKRLLGSLLKAVYPSKDIPLVISVDCSGDTELYEYVEEFEWPFGQKYVNIQEKRLGLKDHIYQCGELTDQFKAIILLEDDLFVSPFFYSYVLKTLDKYGNDSRIAQISLYKNERNGYVGLPFVNIQNGSDVFLMQDVSTWGECWTESMWSEFKQWRDTHSEEDIQKVDMPSEIKGWIRAWSKYYNAYVVDSNKFVIYPNIPVTTNFSDAGEHGGDNNSLVQVNLLQQDYDYRLYDVDKLARYDIYFNNVCLYEKLGIPENDLCLDIYGFHSNEKGCKYILSTKVLPYKIVKSFALNMRPIELNVMYDISGNGLYLYDTTDSNGTTQGRYHKNVVPYFLEGFNVRLLLKYVISYYRNSIKQVLKK